MTALPRLGHYWLLAASNRPSRSNQAGTQTEERVYLGGVELYRARTGATLTAERQTLHIGDDTGRVVMVETLTVGAGSPASTARFQARDGVVSQHQLDHQSG